MLTEQEIKDIKTRAKGFLKTYEKPEDSIPAITSKLKDAYKEVMVWERIKIEVEFLLSQK